MKGLIDSFLCCFYSDIRSLREAVSESLALLVYCTAVLLTSGGEVSVVFCDR